MSVNTYWSGSTASAFLSASASAEATPFGLYDSDSDFRTDAPKTAVWVAKRLGYPIVNIELDNSQIWACFEEATSEYSAQINQFNLRNNLDILRGQPKGRVANFYVLNSKDQIFKCLDNNSNANSTDEPQLFEKIKNDEALVEYASPDSSAPPKPVDKFDTRTAADNPCQAG